MSDSKWRLLQVFLSSGKEPAVFEVEFHTVEGSLRCTCPGFRVRKRCVHVDDVQAVLDVNGGEYPLELDRSVTREQVRAAERSERAQRDLILRHGKTRSVGARR